jgi:hypothetical protein
MTVPTTQRVERPRETRRLSRGVRRPRLIRQASAWLPRRAPEPLPLQDLEQADAIRWVDIYGAGLEKAEVLALLNPICRGQLEEKMVRDLITPERFAAGGSYRNSEVVITSAFRVRHLRRDLNGSGGGNFTSVFEPVQLLVGEDWLLSCWHPSRVFRGLGDASQNGDDTSSGLYLAIARRWPATHAKSAEDLAALVQRELAMANGYRTPKG